MIKTGKSREVWWWYYFPLVRSRLTRYAEHCPSLEWRDRLTRCISACTERSNWYVVKQVEYHMFDDFLGWWTALYDREYSLVISNRLFFLICLIFRRRGNPSPKKKERKSGLVIKPSKKDHLSFSWVSITSSAVKREIPYIHVRFQIWLDFLLMRYLPTSPHIWFRYWYINFTRSI